MSQPTLPHLLAHASEASAPHTREYPINDRREIFGWLMYDWANSAFYTTVVTALLGPYLTSLAQAVVGENGALLRLGGYDLVTAKSFFPYCVAASVFLQVLFLPVVGALADYTNLKKRLLALFCYTAVLATCLLFFVTEPVFVLGGLLFIIANVCFGAAMVNYNGFLPEIATEDRHDKVSSWGFAVGYLGGGVALALNLALVLSAPRLGLTTGMAVRLSLLTAGLWWGGFAIITFTRLRTRARPRSLPPGQSYFTIGFTETLRTFRELLRLRQTLRYLVAYMIYNDGIQTVISMAGVFLAQELFVSRGMETDQSFLLGLILMVQFVAVGGSLLFERIAAYTTTKQAILLALILWSGIVIYAYGFLASITQAWVLGGMIAVVLGGSQALSRSLFSRMIPPGREASFFGLYEISERGTSWIGPFVFGAVVAFTNSYRHAILSLIFFFMAGAVILYFTDTDRAIHDAGHLLPEEAAKEQEAESGSQI